MPQENGHQEMAENAGLNSPKHFENDLFLSHSEPNENILQIPQSDQIRFYESGDLNENYMIHSGEEGTVGPSDPLSLAAPDQNSLPSGLPILDISDYNELISFQVCDNNIFTFIAVM